MEYSNFVPTILLCFISGIPEKATIPKDSILYCRDWILWTVRLLWDASGPDSLHAKCFKFFRWPGYVNLPCLSLSMLFPTPIWSHSCRLFYGQVQNGAPTIINICCWEFLPYRSITASFKSSGNVSGSNHSWHVPFFYLLHEKRNVSFRIPYWVCILNLSFY